MSERNLGVREGNKKPLVICVVRFKCSSIVGIEDNRLPEDPEDNEAMETTAEDQEEGGEENGGDSVIATGEGSEHDGEEMEVDAPPNPSSFPLAMLSSSAEGKEFRIAVVRTNIGFKAGRLNPYGWTWPGVVRFLSNLEWSHNLKENYEEPLNTWAIRNKDLLRTVHLVEIPPTPENGIEFSEWALQFVSSSRIETHIDHLLGKSNRAHSSLLSPLHFPVLLFACHPWRWPYFRLRALASRNLRLLLLPRLYRLRYLDRSENTRRWISLLKLYARTSRG